MLAICSTIAAAPAGAGRLPSEIRCDQVHSWSLKDCKRGVLQCLNRNYNQHDNVHCLPHRQSTLEDDAGARITPCSCTPPPPVCKRDSPCLCCFGRCGSPCSSFCGWQALTRPGYCTCTQSVVAKRTSEVQCSRNRVVSSLLSYRRTIACDVKSQKRLICGSCGKSWCASGVIT